MMTLALVLLAVLHAASGTHHHHHHHSQAAVAEAAICSGDKTAVEGFPNKCYKYIFQPKGADWFASYNLCHTSGGRMFTPESKEEIQSVEASMIPPQFKDIQEGPGIYYVSYVLYASQPPQHWYQQDLIYMPYTPPYSLLDSDHWPGHPGNQSDMWARGEPDGANKDGKFTTPCILGGLYHTGKRGLADVSCNWKPNSVICEFPSEK